MILPYIELGQRESPDSFRQGHHRPAERRASERRACRSSSVLRTTATKTFPVDSLGDRPPYTSPLTDSAGNPVTVAHSNYVGIFGNPEITPDPGFLNLVD